jgi:hypothetical protein
MLKDSIWPGTEIANWGSFGIAIDELMGAGHPRRTVLFRGQPRAWPLRPTLLRVLPQTVDQASVLKAEVEALNHFRSQAHLHDPTQATMSAQSPKLLYWWAWMQHHGAPTRLLDWTASPYVAAYFAAERFPDDDGVILAIDMGLSDAYWEPKRLDDMFTEPWLDSMRAEPCLMAFTTLHKTSRLVAQQGYFTVSANPLTEHDDLLHEAGAARRRLIIPAAMKPIILRHLRTMNVGANSLFPGLDGLGRSTAEIIQGVLG